MTTPSAHVPEDDFPHQAADVRAGQSDEIHLEHQWFGDHEFAALAGVTNLRTLIIDLCAQPVNDRLVPLRYALLVSLCFVEDDLLYGASSTAT